MDNQMEENAPNNTSLNNADSFERQESTNSSVLAEQETTEGDNQSRASVYSVASTVGEDIPLHIAAVTFDLQTVETLASQPDVDVQETDKYGRNAVHNMIRALCAMDKWDPQKANAKAKLVEIVSVLAKVGFDINAKDYSDGLTPIHILSRHQEMSDTIKALLMVGSRVNTAGGKEQRTALHMAVKARAFKNVETLVEGGADTNAADRKGQSPLHLASSGNRSTLICQLLLKADADPNLRDKGGRSPLHVAAKAGRPELVKDLVHGTGTTNGANVNLPDHGGLTALHVAAIHDVTGKVIEELLRKRPDVNAVDWIRRETPLHKAVTLNMQENIRVLCRRKNINVNVQDILGETPLHKASNNKELWLWQTLIKARGDVTIRDNIGQTPLMQALKCANMTAQCVLDALSWENCERDVNY